MGHNLKCSDRADVFRFGWKRTCRWALAALRLAIVTSFKRPKREAGIMRYGLSDNEWATVRPTLPNKARGVPRVDDRRAALMSPRLR